MIGFNRIAGVIALSLHKSLAEPSLGGWFPSIFKSFPITRNSRSNSTRLRTRSHTSLLTNSVRGGTQSATPPSNIAKSKVKTVEKSTDVKDSATKLDIPMNFVFSDVDGTLVHYPLEKAKNVEDDLDLIHLPPSSTGMRGVISSKTLMLCQVLRQKQNVKLVLVSGMRTSTLLKRLPYLPKADAYAPEGGGRIFYPVTENLNEYKGTLVEPVNYSGASDEDVEVFGLVEDMDWREEMSKIDAAGTDGYLGDALNTFLNVKSDVDNQMKEINDRNGALWVFAKSLEREGFILDYKGYTCCFRVNRKQQDKNKIRDEDFDRLSSRDVSQLGLATSVNLGCVDFYPCKSGKKNCCSYLAAMFASKQDGIQGEIIGDDILLQRAFCFCDDDNDLEMASACGRVFLPSVSSKSMAEAAEQNPSKITITENKEENVIETVATESALIRVLSILEERSHLRP